MLEGLPQERSCTLPCVEPWWNIPAVWGLRVKGGVLLPTQSFGSQPAAVSQQGVLREAGGGQPPNSYQR